MKSLKIDCTDGQDERADSSIHLSERELDVLRLVAEGCTSRGAAEMLCLSKKTVDFHLASVFRKLQVTNRIMAVRGAERLGMPGFRFRPSLTHGVEDADTSHGLASLI